MKIAERIRKMHPSLTLAVAARADKLRREGIDVVAFGVGEPDFETPQFIRDAVVEQLQTGKGLGKYTAVPGTPELRAAAAAELSSAHNVSYAAEQVIVSAGAKHSLYNLFMSLLDDGDEVIVPTPAWVSYTDLVSMAGGKPVLLPTHAKDAYQLDAEALSRAITPQTRALLLNSPCNPTGAVYGEATLRAIAGVLLRHPHVFLITDDIYRKLVYGTEYGTRWVSILKLCPELAPRTILVDGVSKTYAMTGWRIGFCAGPVELIKAMSTLQSQSTTNAAAIAQAAAVVALRGPAQGASDPIEAMRVEFDKRRQRMVELLTAIDGVKLTAPLGAFYCFPDLSAFVRGNIKDDVALADHLLDKARVAVVPGSGFFAPGFARLSYATSMERIEEGVKRIAEALRTL